METAKLCKLWRKYLLDDIGAIRALAMQRGIFFLDTSLAVCGGITVGAVVIFLSWRKKALEYLKKIKVGFNIFKFRFTKWRLSVRL